MKKRYQTTIIWLFALVSVLGISASPAVAATLSTNLPVYISNESTQLKLSVYPGKASYTGIASGGLGDGTILDYRFSNDATFSSGGYASAGTGFIGYSTPSGGSGDFNEDTADIWTGTDPGTLTGGIPDFSTSADFGGTDLTIAGRQTVTGTIDISSLVSGTVYILYGTYDSVFSVTFTMSGSGQSDLQEVISADPVTSRTLYLNSVDFDNAEQLYDTITYTCTFTSGSSSRGRFMGVILDGESAAGQILWSSLATTAITSSNATASATHTETLDEHVLVWNTSDQGTNSTATWNFSRNLGAHGAGATSSDLTNLVADTSYTWRLYGSNGISQAWTEGQTFATQLTTCEKPVFTNALTVDQTLNVTLGWQDNADTETGYVLLRSTNGVDFTEVATPAGNAVTTVDTVPLPGVYYYQLAATNTANGSGTEPSLCETNVTVAAPPLYLAPIVNVGSPDISVYPGKAAYSGNGNTGILGDGTVLDYRFFMHPGFSTNGYADGGGGRIPPLTSAATGNDGDADADVWTITDPGSLTDDIPDFGTTADFGGITITTAKGVFGGTIDISGLASGYVYGIGGDGYGGRSYTFTLTMSGSGPTEVVVTGTTSATKCIFVFPFINDGSYDTIDFVTSGTTSTGRFMGVILDGEVPPSGTVFRFR